MNPHRASLAVFAGTGDLSDGVFSLHRGEFHGTAFCLAPNLFLTAAHVYDAALATGPWLSVDSDRRENRCSWFAMPRPSGTLILL